MLMDTILGQMIRAFEKKSADIIWINAMDNDLMRQMEIINTDVQLDDQGVFSDGDPTGDYAPYTERIKRAQGKIWDHMNFDDTGQTRKSIKYTPNKNGISISINDRFDLLDIYSENIIGLTDENKELLHEDIIKNIQKEIIKY